MDRRGFLRLAGAAAMTPALATLLGACGNAEARTGRQVRLGFIALTDCAALIVAQELGLFAERELQVTIEKQASWPATRDALLSNQIDGAHCLYCMPYAVATGVGGIGQRSLKLAMMLNNNGQAITLSKEFAEVGYGDPKAARALLEKGPRTLAMTFPGGTHDLWLRYWLQATGVAPGTVGIQPVPPPQMVANMRVKRMDGFCVGEPWGAVAARKDIGFTHLTSQDLWLHHPEKGLVVNERFPAERRAVLKDLMGAILQASEWLDAPANRAQAAEWIAPVGYVNAPADEIEGRLRGEYDLGADLGSVTYTDDSMVFFRGGEVNAPRRSHALWAMAQYQRFGYLDEAPDSLDIAESIILRDLYEEVAAAEGVDVPDDDMTPFEVALDGATFDPAHPDEEAARP